MTDAAPPKFPKLIVVMAFDPDESGDLHPIGEPMEQQSEERAIPTAQALAGKHAGVIAWSREARPGIGEYGEPTTLFRAGDVPDIEQTGAGPKPAARFSAALAEDDRLARMTEMLAYCWRP